VNLGETLEADSQATHVRKCDVVTRGFLILGGATALAASKKIGPNQLKANPVKTGKIVK